MMISSNSITLGSCPRVTYPDSLALAAKVLEAYTPRSNVMVGVFANGKQQGLHISATPKGRAVTVAQQKRSEDLVVYWGETTHFHPDTNGPTRWGQSVLFAPNDIADAAAWIDTFLEDGETDRLPNRKR